MPHRRAPRHLGHVVLITGAAGLAVTVAFTVVPELRFAYRSPQWHVAIETAAATVAVLAAVLVGQRMRRTRSSLDLLLAAGLGVLALKSLALGVVPKLLSGTPTDLSSWGFLFSSTIGLGLLAVAAVAVDRRPVPPAWRRAVWALPVGVVATVALVLVVVPFPPVADEMLEATPSLAASPVRHGPGAILPLQLVGFGICAVGAAGFWRRGTRRGDELLAWMALAMTLQALARLNYSLSPPLLNDWVYTGDVLRLASYAAILVGSLREIAGYQARLMRAAIVEDRRRIARDLHDGMAQELAFIVALARTKAEEDAADEDLEAVRQAAERALDESREAILALSRPGAQPLRSLLHDTAALVAARSGATLHIDVPADLQVPEPVAEAVLRITREAIANATRHGRARTISVQVRRRGGLEVRILDDGDGFEVEAPRAGMGLGNMRERAQELGGVVRLRSEPGRGTEVQLQLP